VNLSKEAKKIIQESRYQETLLTLIKYTEKTLASIGITPEELQWTMLVNHLNEMIRREKDQQYLENIDPEMFSEISQKSLTIAEKIANQIGQLPKDEVYVLSIHFENLKQNQ
jgi:PRD domain protein (TIGR03582 family)